MSAAAKPRIVCLDPTLATKNYRNDAEQAFAQLARRNGWRVSKRGWPDFLCFGPKGQIIAVEVKPRTADGRLKTITSEQRECLSFLASHGIKCFLSDGDRLERFDASKHRRGARKLPESDARILDL
jgi:hypothetical protein